MNDTASETPSEQDVPLEEPEKPVVEETVEKPGSERVLKDEELDPETAAADDEVDDQEADE